MGQASPSEIKIPAIHQTGIVVKDVQKIAENYWNILGIGPWTVLTLQPPFIYDRTYNGKPAYFEFRVALAQAGECELELMDTLEGPTIYRDFMAEHGEWANHIQYTVKNVDEIDKHVEIMTRNGFPSMMGGHFGDNGGWNYFNTVSALKTIWEPVKMPDAFSGPAVIYPADKSAASPAKIKVKAITQIGIVVKNLEEVMANYWNILGIGPWDIMECKPPAIHDVTYHGKPVNSEWRIAVTNVGPVQLELLQPISGDNIYSDFISDHGEGIHHLQFEVDDIEEANRIMEAEGFPVLMGGGFLEGGFAYYDTAGPLKIIWEAIQLPKTWPTMQRYP